MTESATTASPGGSRKAERLNVIQRLEAYAEDHPEATTYSITSEWEAEEILGAMALSLAALANDVKDKTDRAELTKYGKQYHLAVVERRALEFIRELTDDDELVIYGLKLQVPAIVLQ